MSKLHPCNTCDYWVADTEGKRGECHGALPTSFTQHSDGFRAVWPTTLGSAPGCPEHSKLKKATPAPKASKNTIRKKS